MKFSSNELRALEGIDPERLARVSRMGYSRTKKFGYDLESKGGSASG